MDAAAIEARRSADTTETGDDTTQLLHHAPRHVPAAGLREDDEAYPYVVARLNANWRVVECRGRLQWILQYRRGQRNGQPTWCGRRFHTDRDALLRSVRENAAKGGSFTVGELCEAGLRSLEALPMRLSER
jgi:hypothetical protein